MDSKRKIAIGLVFAAVVVNVAQFQYIDSKMTAPNWKAVHRVERSDITEVNSVDRRYGMFFRLGEVAEGATLVTPTQRSEANLPSFRQKAFGLSRIAGTVERDYDLEAAPDDDTHKKHIVTNDERYVIAAMPPPVHKLVIYKQDGVFVFIDARILNAKQSQALDL